MRQLHAQRNQEVIPLQALEATANLKSGEPDAALWEEGKAPMFRYRDFGDAVPLPAGGHPFAKNGQLFGSGQAFSSPFNLSS